MNHFATTKAIEDGYKAFGQGHDRLREQLLASLPEIAVTSDVARSSSSTRLKWTYAIRSAAAVAAVIMLFFGMSFMMDKTPATPSHTALAASAIERVNHIESIHFTMVTPYNNGGGHVEMWWCKDGRFRMNISDLTIMTGNSERRCILNNTTNTLMIDNPSSSGLEMFIMSELGTMFASEYSLASDWISNSKITGVNEVTYKGEPCLKISSEMDKNRFEYIIDQAEPIIYDAKRITSNGRLLSHVVVLDVNSEMDESLFDIQSTDDLTIKDRRTMTK